MHARGIGLSATGGAVFLSHLLRRRSIRALSGLSRIGIADLIEHCLNGVKLLLGIFTYGGLAVTVEDDHVLLIALSFGRGLFFLLGLAEKVVD